LSFVQRMIVHAAAECRRAARKLSPPRRFVFAGLRARGFPRAVSILVHVARSSRSV
jgi:hypothetical protein